MAQTFEQWMQRVNQILGSTIGLDADDLPDWHYYDAWEDGVPPKEAAREALEYAGAGSLI